jgi:hypothetical protein
MARRAPQPESCSRVKGEETQIITYRRPRNQTEQAAAIATIQSTQKKCMLIEMSIETYAAELSNSWGPPEQNKMPSQALHEHLRRLTRHWRPGQPSSLSLQ